MGKGLILILSHETLLSQLLCYSFQKETRIPCEATADYDNLEQTIEGQSGSSVLLLHDAARENLSGRLEDLQGCLDNGHGCIVSALFNLDHDVAVEKMALKYGVKGFFYRNENLKNMLKGIRTLLAGETWIPRNVLLDLAMSDAPANGKNGHPGSHGLTRREIEILMNLSTGSTNDEIASKLCISSHTVKAHLYSIYHKINVDNRFQAALWAAKHL